MRSITSGDCFRLQEQHLLDSDEFYEPNATEEETVKNLLLQEPIDVAAIVELCRHRGKCKAIVEGFFNSGGEGIEESVIGENFEKDHFQRNRREFVLLYWWCLNVGWTNDDEWGSKPATQLGELYMDQLLNMLPPRARHFRWALNTDSKVHYFHRDSWVKALQPSDNYTGFLCAAVRSQITAFMDPAWVLGLQAVTQRYLELKGKDTLGQLLRTNDDHSVIDDIWALKAESDAEFSYRRCFYAKMSFVINETIFQERIDQLLIYFGRAMQCQEPVLISLRVAFDNSRPQVLTS